jgi:hypothetical protein
MRPIVKTTEKNEKNFNVRRRGDKIFSARACASTPPPAHAFVSTSSCPSLRLHLLLPMPSSPPPPTHAFNWIQLKLRHRTGPVAEAGPSHDRQVFSQRIVRCNCAFTRASASDSANRTFSFWREIPQSHQTTRNHSLFFGWSCVVHKLPRQ